MAWFVLWALAKTSMFHEGSPITILKFFGIG
jgi:hypothetical protein